ncbi:MAG: ester cyclase [Halobacteriota archaeon]
MVAEVWNEGNMDVLEELTHEDYVGHWFSIEGEDTDRDGLRTFIEEARKGFSDFHMDIEFMVAEDDMITVGFTTTGTHDGEFMGIPPTDVNPGETPGIMVHRVEDGKMVEGWATWDALGMMQSLGLVPEEFHLTDFLETGVNMARQGIMRRTADDD